MCGRRRRIEDDPAKYMDTASLSLSYGLVRSRSRSRIRKMGRLRSAIPVMTLLPELISMRTNFQPQLVWILAVDRRLELGDVPNQNGRKRR